MVTWYTPGRPRWITELPSERLSLLPAAPEHILDQEDGAARLNQAVNVDGP